MRWYCQVCRFQIMEKHIDSIKWKNALVLSTPILLYCSRTGAYCYGVKTYYNQQ